nr:ATP-binding cassette domain-containing protein [Agrobacterium salinitolerans]
MALLGPSGSGKTTILQIAAGVIDPVRGRVHRHYRRQGLVFQEPRLLPWMTLIDNIAYGLAAAGMLKRERRERAGLFALEVGLEAADFGKYPVELSGGMRQRAALRGRSPWNRTCCFWMSPSAPSMLACAVICRSFW